MKIAYITSSQKGETDRLLSEIAADLLAQGHALAGIVKQIDYSSQFENGCDMKVRILPTGPVIKITQDLGTGSDACRLDPGAITQAVACVEAGPLDNTDLFILNKFGPEEVAGRGFRDAIGTALGQGVPVLIGIGKANLSAFETFAGGVAIPLPADKQAILKWVQSDLTAKPRP